MRVEMIQHITGTRDGVEWPLAGGTIDLPDHEATDLIGAGLAKEATDEAAPAPADEPTGDGPDEAPAEDGDAAPAVEPDVEPVEAPKPKRARRAKPAEG